MSVLAPPTIYITTDGDMVDAICASAYGPAAGAEHGATEAVYAANPHLADIGPRLPSGVEIYLPALAPRRQPAATPINLWD